ncbi:hypothetical protein NA610_21125, partial [Salmonella sp. NW387]
MVCVVGRMRDLILQLSKSSIYSTKPHKTTTQAGTANCHDFHYCHLLKVELVCITHGRNVIYRKKME